MSKPTLAIIGSGISGMGAAYLLKDRFEITFIEKNNYIGGHTNTLTVNEDGEPIYIDSAFMVYNETTYPLLTRLFKELDVPTKPTDMSFSVNHLSAGLQYSGTGLNGLFAQRQRIFSPRHIRMLLDISRFRQEAGEVLSDLRYHDYSLGRYAKERQYSEDFLTKFLVPMSSAVWSMPYESLMNFPVATLVRFFKNHCFLDIKGHLQWRTCVNGSQVYRDKIMSVIKPKVLLNTPVKSVKRLTDQVEVIDEQGQEHRFDYVLMASHADETLRVLTDATVTERSLLAQFPYHANRGILHTDAGVMPTLKRTWSSWNYRVEKNGHTSTIYWMNNLQGVSKKKDYFISINDDSGLINPKKIIWQTIYSHPQYSVGSQLAQEKLHTLNGSSRVFFAGAYFRYGFHEDGLWSGVQAARALAKEDLWT